MFLTRDFASVMETVQVNVQFLGNFDLYTGYLHCFFQSCLNCFFFSFFLTKSLKLFFVYKKFKKFQQKMNKLQKTAFSLKPVGKPVKANLNILSIRLSITALSKINLHCPFPLLVSNKIPK